MTPSEMRAEVFERDGYRCQWPGCTLLLTESNPLQLAHIRHRGMGGSESANTPGNGVALCAFHHDIFDGRQGQGKTRTEIAAMLRAVVGIA